LRPFPAHPRHPYARVGAFDTRTRKAIARLGRSPAPLPPLAQRDASRTEEMAAEMTKKDAPEWRSPASFCAAASSGHVVAHGHVTLAVGRPGREGPTCGNAALVAIRKEHTSTWAGIAAKLLRE